MLVDIGELVDWLQNSINQAIANYHRTVVLDCKSSPADVFPRTVSICYTHKNFGRVIQMNEWMNLCFCLDTLCSFIWPTHCKLCVFCLHGKILFMIEDEYLWKFAEQHIYWKTSLHITSSFTSHWPTRALWGH